MTVLKWLVVLASIGYLGGLVVLFFGQRAFIFPVPQTVRTAPEAAGFPEAEEHVLTTADGEQVIVWHVPAKPGHAVVIYFPGNGDFLAGHVGRLRDITSDGTGLVALSYRGYAGSSGRPSERGLLLDAAAAYAFTAARYGADRAHSILNNHTCKVVLPGVGDPETADVLSRLVGQRHFTDVQVNRGADGRVSRTYAARLEPLATPDALRQLHEGTAVVLYRGRPAAVIRTKPWFENRTMRRLSQRSYVRNAEEVRRAA